MAAINPLIEIDPNAMSAMESASHNDHGGFSTGTFASGEGSSGEVDGGSKASGGNGLGSVLKSVKKSMYWMRWQFAKPYESRYDPGNIIIHPDEKSAS